MGAIYGFLGPPVDWALTHLYSAFSSVALLHTIGAFGLAIIVVTLAIRLCLFPLYGWQIRTQRRIQAEQRLIGPQIQQIRKKHKGDNQRIHEETMRIYREHGINPMGQMAGCLPLLLQIPILGGLYTGINSATKGLHSQHLGFLWISDISKAPKDLGGFFSVAMLLPLLAAAATFVTSKMVMQPPRPDMSDQERQTYTITKNMIYLGPGMVLLFGINFSQGIALYWFTQSLFMIAQQWVVMGWGGLNVPHWVPGSDRVTPLSYPRPEATAKEKRERERAAAAAARLRGRDGDGRKPATGAAPPGRSAPAATAPAPGGRPGGGNGRASGRGGAGGGGGRSRTQAGGGRRRRGR